MLNHISQTIENINEQLSPRGAYGISFNTVIKESLRTIQGQNKINNLLITIEKEVSSLTTQFAESCRVMQYIFTGILSTEKNSRYDTLVNIATIQGKTNILFRQKMKETLNNLWDKYFLEECSVINTTEEKELMKKLGDLREQAYAQLNDEQKEMIEKCFDINKNIVITFYQIFI